MCGEKKGKSTVSEDSAKVGVEAQSEVTTDFSLFLHHIYFSVDLQWCHCQYLTLVLTLITFIKVLTFTHIEQQM